MKRLALMAACLVLSGCDELNHFLGLPPAQLTSPATPTGEKQEPIILTGQGTNEGKGPLWLIKGTRTVEVDYAETDLDEGTKNIILSQKTYSPEMELTFVLWLLDRNFAYKSMIANEIGNLKQSYRVEIKETGNYFLKIKKAYGNWTITIR